MNLKPPPPPPLNVGTWRGVLFQWLMQQGVSTVLLFAILGGVYKAVPEWLEKHNVSIEKTNLTFTSALKEQRIDYLEEKALMRKDYITSLELVTNQFSVSIDKLTEELKQHKR